MNTETPKSPLLTEHISWGPTFKNNCHRQFALAENLLLGTNYVGKVSVRSNRRKFREMTTPYCRNTLKGKHGPKENLHWRKKKI